MLGLAHPCVALGPPRGWSCLPSSSPSAFSHLPSTLALGPLLHPGHLLEGPATVPQKAKARNTFSSGLWAKGEGSEKAGRKRDRAGSPREGQGGPQDWVGLQGASSRGRGFVQALNWDFLPLSQRLSSASPSQGYFGSQAATILHQAAHPCLGLSVCSSSVSVPLSALLGV